MTMRKDEKLSFVSPRGPFDVRTCSRGAWRAYRLLRAAKFPSLERNYAFERACMPEHTLAANRLRVRNRYRFARAGLVKRGDGTQIHHKNGNPFDNRPSNLQVIPKAQHTELHWHERRRAAERGQLCKCK